MERRYLADYEIDDIDRIAGPCPADCDAEVCRYIPHNKQIDERIVNALKTLYCYATRNDKNGRWEYGRMYGDNNGMYLSSEYLQGVVFCCIWVQFKYGTESLQFSHSFIVEENRIRRHDNGTLDDAFTWIRQCETDFKFCRELIERAYYKF